MKKFILLFSAIAVMASCTKSNELIPGTDTPEEIRLTSNIGLTAESRAVITNATASLEFSFVRLDQSAADGTYPAYTTISTALDVTRSAGGATASTPTTIAFDGGAQYYLTHTTHFKTKLVGWYPRATPASGVVTIPVDGDTDIMLSQEIEGDRTAPANKFGTSGKVFTFAHQLTQVQVKAYAADDAAITAWGEITSIKLKDQAGKVCNIALPDGVVFTPPGSATDLAIAGGLLPLALTEELSADDAHDFGYAMIAPLAGTDPLTLIIETEKGGIKEITPTSTGYAVSTAYVITLKFSSTEIVPTAVIGEWTPGATIPEIEIN